MSLDESHATGDSLSAAEFDLLVHQVNQHETAIPTKVDKATLTVKGDIYIATASGVVTRLPIGTDTQVLTADSSQSTGARWATPAAGGGSDPLTTAGDILVRNATASVRKAVGTNGQILQVNTTKPDKLEWVALPTGYTDPLTTAGDIVTRGASATGRRAVGTNGQVLRVNTANADKLEYATLAKADVGLSAVDNLSLVSERTAAVAYTNKTINGDLNTITNIGASALKTVGPASASTVLYGDMVWRVPGTGGGGGGLTFTDNFDGTGDLVGASFVDNNDGTATV